MHRFLTRNGVRLHWRADGDPRQPAMLLLHSLGTDHTLWDGVVDALAGRCWLLRADARGHGASEMPLADATIDDLAADALAVLDAAGVGQAAVAGVSMGGMVAMQMAVSAPDRLTALAVCNSAPDLAGQPWRERIELVRLLGVAALAEMILAGWFPRAVLRANPPCVAAVRAMLARQDTEGYAGCAAALAGLALGPRLSAITVPTLVLAGEFDLATPPTTGAEPIAAAIPGARLMRLPTGHLAPLEQPETVAALLAGLLAAVEPAPA